MDFFIILVQVVWTRKGLQMKGSDKHQMTYEESSGRVSTPAIEKQQMTYEESSGRVSTPAIDKHQMTYEESSGRVSTPAIEKGWREKQRQRSSRLSKYIQLLAALAV